MKALLNKANPFILFLLCSYAAYTQVPGLDSVKKVLQTEKEDTNKVNTLLQLAGYYGGSHADTGVTYAQQALDLAEKLNFEIGILSAEGALSWSLSNSGNYPLALDYAFKTLSLAKKMNRPAVPWAYSMVFYNYYYLGEYNTTLKYTREAVQLCDTVWEIYFGWRDLALVFHKLNEPDSAMLYAKKAYQRFKSTGTGNISNVLGDAYAGKGNYDSALFFYRNGIPVAQKQYNKPELIDCYNNIAGVYKATNLDSATWYSKKVLDEKIEKSYPLGLLKATNMLADIYQSQNKPDSALKYLREAIKLKDSLFSREKTIAIQNIAFKEQEKQKEVEAAKLQSQNRLKMYSLLGGLFIILAIAGLLFRNNRQKQKSNTKIEKAYAELKSTQAQLIQGEKMASLGELTAGIAHEIQNPLNFVNNFSEVNTELIDEMQQELKAGNNNEAISISNNIKENQEKINQHGKRADVIVKGMLQHSRSSSGVKEPTDINALADEYLRLAYHGLRAKDKSFNATMKTNYDETIGSINIIPQDIGRVILNLITNAFYAVTEKKKQLNGEYEPTVSVSTKKNKDKVEIKVKDNGNGIPQKVMDKIFQPFFTTKPTGQGTGLGLSLSYDIIKAHSGELKAETREGEGAEFIILLPA
ncbi:MAG TPA: ATP-binding protein [Chitinophagaceae bacterium]|nr:ATP-binding protein [Chitinophagaceae bacterium]